MGFRPPRPYPPARRAGPPACEDRSMTSATPADPAGGGASYPTYPGADGQSYAYPGAEPGPWANYAAPTTLAVEPRPSGKAKGLTALAVAAVIAVLGLPLGWIWSSFAPWLPGVGNIVSVAPTYG